MILIAASPCEGTASWLPSVIEDAKRARQFADRYKFEVHQLIGRDATPINMDLFFSRQTTACLEHRRKGLPGKYLLLVYYSGHGSLRHGTTHVYLPKQSEPGHEWYPLAAKVMNFQTDNVSNTFVFSVNDCC